MATCLFLELFLSHDDMEKLHDFEEECAEDYFREKEIQLQSSSDKRIQVINERYTRIILPYFCLGPVVQCILSLTSSLRGQLVKCFTTL